MHLMGADALLARIEQMGCQPPFSQRHLGTLEYGADRDRELAFTFVAVVEAGAMRPLLAFYLGDLVPVRVAAMRANGTIGPAHGFKSLASRVLVREDRVLCFGLGHDALLSRSHLPNHRTFVKYIIPTLFLPRIISIPPDPHGGTRTR